VGPRNVENPAFMDRIRPAQEGIRRAPGRGAGDRPRERYPDIDAMTGTVVPPGLVVVLGGNRATSGTHGPRLRTP
jgi:hypothetical protein